MEGEGFYGGKLKKVAGGQEEETASQFKLQWPGALHAEAWGRADPASPKFWLGMPGGHPPHDPAGHRDGPVLAYAVA